MALCACTTPKVYFESVQMLARFPVLNSKAQVCAIARWRGVPLINLPRGV